MEAVECIKGRRSIRDYTGRDITRETLEEIVETASYAPSWKNSQTVSYIAVKNPEIKERIAREGMMSFVPNQHRVLECNTLMAVLTENGISGYNADGSATTTKGSHWQSFDAGIAEALGLVGEVCDSTKVLLESVKQALNQTIVNPEFQDRFKTLLVKAEKLEDRILVMLNTADPQLRKSLEGLNQVTVKVNNLIDGVKPPIDNMFANTEKVMGNADKLLGELEEVTSHLDELVVKVQKKIESKDNTVGILLNDRTLHDDLVKTVHSADSLVRIILQDGLDINVDFF